MREKMFFCLPGNEILSSLLTAKLGFPQGKTVIRRFPDGESYIRVEEDVRDKEAIIVCTLNEPDDKLLPLYFLSAALREFGASKVTLVAPYLAYMRQDKRFNEGEAITSELFANLISGFVDRLVTIDPHLHRHSKLKEIYTIPTTVVHSAGVISEWIKHNIKMPLLIGPDEESAQWVSEVARNADAPFIVLSKLRMGDNEVEINVPDVSHFKNYRPVLVDDIISTAHTMAETVLKIQGVGLQSPVCIGVHGVFANGAELLLTSAGAEIITSNSIPHPTNRIDISGLLVRALE